MRGARRRRWLRPVRRAGRGFRGTAHDSPGWRLVRWPAPGDSCLFHQGRETARLRAADECAGGEIEDQAAIDLGIEGEVEVVERLVRIAEAGVFQCSEILIRPCTDRVDVRVWFRMDMPTLLATFRRYFHAALAPIHDGSVRSSDLAVHGRRDLHDRHSAVTVVKVKIRNAAALIVAINHSRTRENDFKKALRDDLCVIHARYSLKALGRASRDRLYSDDLLVARTEQDRLEYWSRRSEDFANHIASVDLARIIRNFDLNLLKPSLTYCRILRAARLGYSAHRFASLAPEAADSQVMAVRANSTGAYAFINPRHEPPLTPRVVVDYCTAVHLRKSIAYANAEAYSRVMKA